MAGKRKLTTRVVSVVQEFDGVYMARFFFGCDNPIAVHDFKLQLAQGRLIDALRLPTCLLPHALLLHAVAPEPGVVEDCAALVTLLEEEYNHPHRGPAFWHPECHLVSAIVYGVTSPDDLQNCPDAQYLFNVLEQLTGPHALQRMQLKGTK